MQNHDSDKNDINAAMSFSFTHRFPV